jgi:iron complex transport system ATP-binding protein
LIRVLLGQLQARGEIVWEGRDLSAWRNRDLARRVAYLPQSPTFEPEHRVIDVLRLGRAPYWRAFGMESARDAEAVDRVARLLDLTGLLDRPLDRLSGGQRQRVFVGRCLVQEPAVMLLDEPNTFLDLKHQIGLANLLNRLATEQQIGVIMASHDINLAAMLSNRMVLLSEGMVVRDGEPSVVLDPEVLAQAYGIAMERIDREGRAPLVFPRV